MPGESVNIFEVNQSSQGKSINETRPRLILSVILQDVDYFGGILNGIKVSS